MGSTKFSTRTPCGVVTCNCIWKVESHFYFSGSPPVQMPPVSSHFYGIGSSSFQMKWRGSLSHFYPDQLYVSNTTSNGRKYSKSILRKSQRFPTKHTTQIDAVRCQALRHLLRWPPPPRLHLGFRLDHHHHLVIYTRFLNFLKKKERWRRNNSFWGYFFWLISVGFWHELGISWIRGFQKPWGKFLKKKKKTDSLFFWLIFSWSKPWVCVLC